MAFDGERMLQTFAPTVRAVLQGPDAFFRGLRRIAYYKDPALYLLGLTIVGAAVGVPFASFSTLFLWPVFAFAWLAGIWLWAAYLGWAARRLAGARLTTVNAFQLAAYAATPLVILHAVPYLNIAAGIWFLYLCGLGLARFGKASPRAAAAIVGVPAVLLWLPMLVLTAKFFAFLPKLPALLGGKPAA